MRRYPSRAAIAYSFGPGPMSRAVKIIILLNVGVYLLSSIEPALVSYLGLTPALVLHRFAIYQPVTYMFVHAPWPSIGHILFNMLALWMFGVELERLWGTRFFVRFYVAAGLGGAAASLLLAFLPFGFGEQMYYSTTIGASGAIYGLLLAYALYFPNRPIYIWAIFPIRAKYLVMFLGGLAFLLSITSSGGGIAHVAHLGGLVTGYLYLKLGGAGGIRPMAELKYRYFKWKMNRHRRRFDVHQGGRANDWDRRIH